MAENKPETEAETRGIINSAAKELGLTLNEQQVQSLLRFI